MTSCSAICATARWNNPASQRHRHITPPRPCRDTRNPLGRTFDTTAWMSVSCTIAIVVGVWSSATAFPRQIRRMRGATMCNLGCLPRAPNTTARHKPNPSKSVCQQACRYHAPQQATAPSRRDTGGTKTPTHEDASQKKRTSSNRLISPKVAWAGTLSDTLVPVSCLKFRVTCPPRGMSSPRPYVDAGSYLASATPSVLGAAAPLALAPAPAVPAPAPDAATGLAAVEPLYSVAVGSAGGDITMMRTTGAARRTTMPSHTTAATPGTVSRWPRLTRPRVQVRALYSVAVS